MSAFTCSTVASRLLVIILLALTLGFPGPATAIAGGQPLGAATRCGDAMPLELPTVWRDPGRANGTACFTLDLDPRAVEPSQALVIELQQPATVARIHLALVHAASNAHVILQTATTLVLTATPGPVRFSVVTDDPREPLASFRLDIGLARMLPTKDEDDTELELEPDPIMAIIPRTKDEDDTELELEPDPIVANIDVTPSDLSLLAARYSFTAHDALHLDGSDDHGDTLLHATAIPLDQTVAGSLDNAWGDDVDTFRFDLTRTGPIVIQVESEVTLDVELFDRHGLRIVRNSSFHDRGRWVQTLVLQTLVPGRYFVRFTGPQVPYTATIQHHRH